MENLKKIRENILGNRGGISSIISTVVTIILVLGLISYAVLNQVAGAKDAGDKAVVEQNKISLMLQNPDTVTGNTVKTYASQQGITVTIYKPGGSVTMTAAEVLDGALFKISKSYNADGVLSTVTFEQINLER